MLYNKNILNDWLSVNYSNTIDPLQLKSSLDWLAIGSIGCPRSGGENVFTDFSSKSTRNERVSN